MYTECVKICQTCGGKLSPLNKSGFCSRTEACNAARRQANSERYYTRNKNDVLERQKSAYRQDPSRALATCAEYRKNNPGKIKEGRRRQYGLKPGEYEAMLVAQNDRCRGCQRTDALLRVDHDHSCCQKLPTCGKCNRGLLCDTCNRGVGFLKDDPATLRALADYLDEYEARK